MFNVMQVMDLNPQCDNCFVYSNDPTDTISTAYSKVQVRGPVAIVRYSTSDLKRLNVNEIDNALVQLLPGNRSLGGLHADYGGFSPV